MRSCETSWRQIQDGVRAASRGTSPRRRRADLRAAARPSSRSSSTSWQLPRPLLESSVRERSPTLASLDTLQVECTDRLRHRHSLGRPPLREHDTAQRHRQCGPNTRAVPGARPAPQGHAEPSDQRAERRFTVDGLVTRGRGQAEGRSGVHDVRRGHRPVGGRQQPRGADCSGSHAAAGHRSGDRLIRARTAGQPDRRTT